MPTLPPRPRIAPGPSRHVYDVLVLGAELGGALAAALLAKRGLRVLWAEHANLAPGYEHDGFSHITLRFGYQDDPDVPRARGQARRADQLEVDFNPYHATYYLSQMNIVPTDNGGMAPWRKSLFMAMARNAASPVGYFNLPPERVVALGAQIRF